MIIPADPVPDLTIRPIDGRLWADLGQLPGIDDDAVRTQTLHADIQANVDAAVASNPDASKLWRLARAARKTNADSAAAATMLADAETDYKAALNHADPDAMVAAKEASAKASNLMKAAESVQEMLRGPLAAAQEALMAFALSAAKTEVRTRAATIAPRRAALHANILARLKPLLKAAFNEMGDLFALDRASWNSGTADAIARRAIASVKDSPDAPTPTETTDITDAESPEPTPVTA